MPSHCLNKCRLIVNWLTSKIYKKHLNFKWNFTYNVKFHLKFRRFSFNKMQIKLSSAKYWPFCLGLNVINTPRNIITDDDILYQSMQHHWQLIPKTGNHYKWDWPKSQFCMLNILATIDWLRNLKVANIYFFNVLQTTLNIFSFSKLEIRKLENLIFPSSAEPCRILQNSALVPQNSAEHFGEKLRNSADFCRILQNSAE